MILPVTSNCAADGKDMRNAIEMADDVCDPQMATQGGINHGIDPYFV
ncbi:hypothetical protein [Brevibacillus formosus]